MIPIGLIILKRCCLIFEDSGVDQKQAEKLADPLGVECLAVPITVEEIKRTIGNLKLNKSPGPDGILEEILKIYLHQTIPFLAVLSSRIFDTWKYPRARNSAIILQIHKSRDRDNSDYYRGVSLVRCAHIF